MELELGEGVDVDEGGDGAGVGRLHGVGVDVDEGGDGANKGRLHGVMFMGVLLTNFWLSFSNEKSSHLNPGDTGYISFYGTTHVLKYGVV